MRPVATPDAVHTLQRTCEKDDMKINRYAITLVLSFCALPVFAETDWVHSPAPYAKQLADETVASHPSMLDAIFHVTPPGTDTNYAVAAHTAKEQGSKSGEDDMSVVTTGKPLVEVQKDGVRIGVILPLQDKSHQVIGALGLMYVYHKGENETAFLKRSEKIRDDLARKIVSGQALFQ